MPKDFRHTSGALDDDFFYGREIEISELHNNINIRQHTALIGQRQFGKTSLVFKAVARHPDSPLLAHIDLTRKATLSEAAKVLIDTFMAENFGIKRFIVLAMTAPGTLFEHIIKPISLVKKIKLKEFELEIKELGQLAALEAGNKSVDLFVSAVEFIDAISVRLDKKVVIFIDEFQRLVAFPELKEADVMWPLRSVIQNSKVATLIVAGSKPSVVKHIINDPEGAFLHSFIERTIYGVARTDFVEHFAEVCQTYKVDNIPALTSFVYALCGGIPSYLSLFGRKLFDAVARRKSLWPEMYFDAIDEMFRATSGTHRAMEERLSEINMGLVVYKAVFSGKNPKTDAVRLSGTSEANIQNNSIRRLEEEGYIVKIARGEYRVVDPVFGFFLAEINDSEQFGNIYQDILFRSIDLFADEVDYLSLI